MSKTTCTVSTLAGEVLKVYTPNERYIASVMTMPTDVQIELVERVFGIKTQLVSAGTGTNCSETTQPAEHVFKTVTKFTIGHGVLRADGVYSYVDTDGARYTELVLTVDSDYSENYANGVLTSKKA